MSFPPVGFDAVQRVTITNQQPLAVSRTSNKTSELVRWQGQATQVTTQGDVSSYLRFEPNSCQKRLDNKCCQCLFPPAKIDNVGNLACCATCAVFWALGGGGALSLCSTPCCALGCYNCCKCDEMTNCGKPIGDDSEIFNQPWFTRNPSNYSAYTPKSHSEAEKLIKRT